MRVTRGATLKAAGFRLYRRVKHVAGELDHGIQTAARFYGSALQPALRAAGVDTREADKHLMGSYSGYRELKDRLDQGFRVGDGVVAALGRGQDWSYPA